jgi:hypothetical protein
MRQLNDIVEPDIKCGLGFDNARASRSAAQGLSGR